MNDDADRSGAFAYGVASGDPTESSVVIWTTTPAGRRGEPPPSVEWEVAHEADFADPVAQGAADSTTDGDGDRRGDVHDLPVSVRVEGLEPATTYHYRFRADGVESSVGVTHTLATPDTDRSSVRVALACCARIPTGSLDPYADLAELRPDLVVHLGDYIYEDDTAPHDPPRFCRSEDDYRRRYAQYRADGSLQRLHAIAPWIAVWDDHEVADDSWRSGSPADETDSTDYEERRRAAARAYLDWMPQEPSRTGPTIMDRHLRLGALADVVVLDARQAHRDEPAGRSGPALVDPADDRGILSDEQWDWLAERVADCDGWLILCTQTQVAPLRLARLPNPKRRFRVHPLVNPGQWDGYPVERDRLARVLAPVAGRVLLCSGDLHGRFHTVLENADTGARFPEITTPSISSVPFADTIRRRAPIPAGLLRRWLGWLNPHISSMDLRTHGSTVLDISPGTIDVTALDTCPAVSETTGHPHPGPAVRTHRLRRDDPTLARV